MAFAPADLVLSAVEQLEDGGHPVAVLVLPALLLKARQLGLDPVVDPVPFGTAEEVAVLETYFRLPRSPYPDRPFRSTWYVQAGRPEARWQKLKYAGGSTQRMRTGVSGLAVFEQIKDPGGDRWRLRPGAGTAMASWENSKPIRLADLALWYGRDQDVADLDALIQWFKDEFEPDVGDLLGTVYLDEVPASYTTHPFVDQTLDETDFFERMGSLPEAVTVSGSLSELIARLETSLRASKFHLPDELVSQVLSAWLAGDIVVLVGQPGTGKTRFATLLAAALTADLGLEEDPLLLPVRADFDEGEFLGYERLDGSPHLRPFATDVVQADSPLEPRVVILEEFNLATVESYMASVLIALQEPSRAIHLPGGIAGTLPIDSLIIATCNSYRDEPETRMRVSSPTKRRAVVITMRNVLADAIEKGGGTSAPGFEDLVADLTVERIVDEVRRIDDRGAAGQATTLDALRLAQLRTVTTRTNITVEARSRLGAVVRSVLDTPEGRSWLTFGLLRDTALALGLADRTEAAEVRALVGIVGSKLLHQVRGPISNVEALASTLTGLAGASDIDDLVDQLKRGSADEVVPLL